MHDELHTLAFALTNNSDHRRLVRAASRLLGTADAEDAVQDAYVRALEADALELNAAQAWLLTVVRNLAIDRLRRRQWMQQWLTQANHTGETATESPSAEMDAALAQEARRALGVLAANLSPEDGAALLLHEVFEVGHAEIATASGRSEAGSRQQLRRALLRLRQLDGAAKAMPHCDRERAEETETVFRLYLHSLQLRDPQTLWAMLRNPPISASAQRLCFRTTSVSASTPHAIPCGVVQMGGNLGLVLTLDGVRLCVVPLGVYPAREPYTA